MSEIKDTVETYESDEDYIDENMDGSPTWKIDHRIQKIFQYVQTNVRSSFLETK